MGNDGVTDTTTPNAAAIRRAVQESQGSIVEPRAAREASGANEELFLTPRVLDASAFARYAETLKGIIAQASSHGRTLEDFAADAETMIKRCNDTSDSVNKRLQAGIRILKMIDERSERIDMLLEKVSQVQPDTQAMSDRIDNVITERVRASETRIDEMISQVVERAELAERRAHAAIERTQAHSSELEVLGKSIDQRLSSLRQAVEQSAGERESGVEMLRTQVENAHKQINDTITRALDQVKIASGTIAESTNEGIREIETRAGQVYEGIQSAKDSIAGQTEQQKRAFESFAVQEIQKFQKSSEVLSGKASETIIAIDSRIGLAFEKANEASEALTSRSNEEMRSMESRVEVAIEKTKKAGEALSNHASETMVAIDSRIGLAGEKAQQLNDSLTSKAQEEMRAIEACTEQAMLHAKTTSDSISSRANSEMSSVESRVELALVKARDAVDSVSGRASETVVAIDSRIEMLDEKAREANELISRRANEEIRTLESRVGAVGQTIEPLIESSNKAMRALGMDPNNPVYDDSPLARIESLVERGETQLASLDRVYRQLEDLRTQAEDVKSVFGSWLLDAANQLDGLESRKDAIVGPMSDAAKTINMIGPDLDEKLEMASVKLSHLQLEQQTLRTTIEASSKLANSVSGDLTNQAGQLQALLDGSLNSLSTRVEQAGLWLGNLISRADTIGASLRGINRMDFQSESGSGATEIGTSLPASPFGESSPPAQPTTNETGVPRQLPIDSISFDGSETVIEHKNPIDDQSR